MTDDLKARLRSFDPHTHELEVVDEAADYIDALELALTQSRAETAAAYDRAADVITGRKSEIDDVSNTMIGANKIIFAEIVSLLDVVATAIRALATPDQTAALDAVRAAERERIAAMVKSYGEGPGRPQCKHDCEALAAAIKGAKA
jgi:hypothetical protein